MYIVADLVGPELSLIHIIVLFLKMGPNHPVYLFLDEGPNVVKYSFVCLCHYPQLNII